MKFGPAYTIVHRAMRHPEFASARREIISLQKEVVVADQARVNGMPFEIDDNSVLGKSLHELEHDLAIHEHH